MLKLICSNNPDFTVSIPANITFVPPIHTLMTQVKLIVLLFASLLLISCNKHKQDKSTVVEDTVAKKDLQGIWLNEDGEDPTFRIHGDTIYFPDSTSAPVRFYVENDTLALMGANITKYHIIKRTPHLFIFVNQNGERVRLVKSSDTDYLEQFEQKTSVVSINQQRLIKRDTIVYLGQQKYHCYVQVNPTTYKIVIPSCNDDGVEVDNVYFDNIVHLSIFNGEKKLFSQNLNKSDFDKCITQDILHQTVLSDLIFYGIDKEGIHYFSILAIPNSSSSYMVELIVDFTGKLHKRIAKN